MEEESYTLDIIVLSSEIYIIQRNRRVAVKLGTNLVLILKEKRFIVSRKNEVSVDNSVTSEEILFAVQVENEVN